MAQIHAFQGLRYNPDRIPVEKAVTQPYDKISAEMQEKYYAMHPHNIIRIILGRKESGDGPDSNTYTRAAAYIRDWRQDGIVTPMTAPAVVVYFQRFTVPGTQEVRQRKGFIALGRLEDYANKVVYPHERTLTGPKEDRLQLLRHTRTHFEQIFMLYEDPEQQIDHVLDEAAARDPDIDVLDEYGVSHRLWILDDPGKVEFIRSAMASKKLVIADGHHRYETALAYRDERRQAAGGAVDPDAAFERMPMTFFNMHSPALTVLPTHRVVAGVKDFDPAVLLRRAGEFFDIAEAPSSSEEFRSALAKGGTKRVTIGLRLPDGSSRLLGLREGGDRAMGDLSPALKSLDVMVLHRLILEKCLDITEDAVRKESHITYVREFDAALGAVAGGRAQAAFLLNPTRLDQLRDIAYEGNVMPQKSTDFYPKVLSGLVMYAVE